MKSSPINLCLHQTSASYVRYTRGRVVVQVNQSVAPELRAQVQVSPRNPLVPPDGAARSKMPPRQILSLPILDTSVHHVRMPVGPRRPSPKHQIAVG